MDRLRDLGARLAGGGASAAAAAAARASAGADELLMPPELREGAGGGGGDSADGAGGGRGGGDRGGGVGGGACARATLAESLRGAGGGGAREMFGARERGGAEAHHHHAHNGRGRPQHERGGPHHPPHPLAEHAEHAEFLKHETKRWEAVADLDAFLARVHAYHSERGLACALLSRALNLLTLAFTVFLSTFLIVKVDWERLAACNAKDECDIVKEAIREAPKWSFPAAAYCAVFSAYLVASSVGLARELPRLLEMRRFFADALQVRDAELPALQFPELLKRLAGVQDTRRICLAKELTPLEMMMRVLRRDNYMVGLVDSGVLPVHVGVPRLGWRRPMLTAYVQMAVDWFVLDHFLDASACRVRAAAVAPGAGDALRLRLLAAGVTCLVLSPFLFVFAFVFFFIRHAEYLYRHPAAVGERDWTGYARHKLRALNETPRALERRLALAHAHAVDYVSMFPSAFVGMIAKFVAFVVGAFAAMLLFVAAMDEELLRAEVGDRQLLWYAALFTVVLAICRALSPDASPKFEPRETLLKAMKHLRFSPRAWRLAPASRAAQSSLAELFQPRATLFLEEMVSVLVAPLMLLGPIAQRSGDLVAFFRDNTVYVEGVGDVFAGSDFCTARGAQGRPQWRGGSYGAGNGHGFGGGGGGFGEGGGDSGGSSGNYGDGSYVELSDGTDGHATAYAHVTKVDASMALFADSYGREGWAEPGTPAARVLDAMSSAQLATHRGVTDAAGAGAAGAAALGLDVESGDLAAPAEVAMGPPAYAPPVDPLQQMSEGEASRGDLLSALGEDPTAISTPPMATSAATLSPSARHAPQLRQDISSSLQVERTHSAANANGGAVPGGAGDAPAGVARARSQSAAPDTVNAMGSAWAAALMQPEGASVAAMPDIL